MSAMCQKRTLSDQSAANLYGRDLAAKGWTEHLDAPPRQRADDPLRRLWHDGANRGRLDHLGCGIGLREPKPYW
jgi:hypothetical protein